MDLGFQRLTLLMATSLLMLLSACGGQHEADNTSATPVTLNVDFSQDSSAWALGYSDHSDNTAPANVHMQLSEPLGPPFNQRALQISGTNRSDDMFVFIRRRVDQLAPSTLYLAKVSLELVAGIPQGCMGVGGAPGEAVYVKTAVSEIQPHSVRQADGNWVMNIDKGNQASSGLQGQTLGNITNSDTDCQWGRSERKTLSTSKAITVHTNTQGQLWWLLGQDSGYEAGSSLVLLRATLQLDPA